MLACIVGTRPEIIKLAPLIREASGRNCPMLIIHTGQHYSYELDKEFFEELELPAVDVRLAMDAKAGWNLDDAISQLRRVLKERQVTAVVVQGDTSSVLAGAIAAALEYIPVAHLEAGLRSGDWSMPEERNCVLVARMATWHFCPTQSQQSLLEREGIHSGVHVVGNSIVDSLKWIESKAKTPTIEGLRSRYAVVTLHRPSNVDDGNRLSQLLTMIDESCRALDLDVVFPVHPRTAQVLQGLEVERHWKTTPGRYLLPPVSYMQLVGLMKHANCVITDSGGLQEEACILRVPCVTLRATTERPETLHDGANALYAGTDVREFTEILTLQSQRARTWECPFGDGTTAKKCLDVLSSTLPARAV